MRAEEDFIYFKVGDQRDPQHLRKVLTAHFHFERLRQARRYFITVLALLGAALWLLAVWPGVVSKETRSIGLQLWGFCMAATLILSGLELKWYLRRARLMRENPPSDEHPSPP